MPKSTNIAPNKRGPKTPEGRQRSSRNAIRHGLTAQQVVVAHESRPEFEALKAAIIDELQPATEIESQLVDDLIKYRWRLGRIVRIETATFDIKLAAQERWVDREYPNADTDVRLALAFESLADGPSLKLLDRYEARFRRAYDRTLTTLRTLQTERRAQEAAQEAAQQPPLESKTSAKPAPRTAPAPQKMPNEFPPPAPGPVLVAPNRPAGPINRPAASPKSPNPEVHDPKTHV